MILSTYLCAFCRNNPFVPVPDLDPKKCAIMKWSCGQRCYPNKLMCDGYINCADGSDESVEGCSNGKNEIIIIPGIYNSSSYSKA